MPRFAAASVVHKTVNEWINDNQANRTKPQAERKKETRAPASFTSRHREKRIQVRLFKA